MRVLFKRPFLLCVLGIILTTYSLSASAGPTKDKKKLLEKLRNALNQTELDEANAAAGIEGAPENATVEVEPESKVSEEEPAEKIEEQEIDAPEEKKTAENEKEENTAELQKVDGPTSYLRKNLGSSEPVTSYAQHITF